MLLNRVQKQMLSVRFGFELILIQNRNNTQRDIRHNVKEVINIKHLLMVGEDVLDVGKTSCAQTFVFTAAAVKIGANSVWSKKNSIQKFILE